MLKAAPNSFTTLENHETIGLSLKADQQNKYYFQIIHACTRPCASSYLRPILDYVPLFSYCIILPFSDRSLGWIYTSGKLGMTRDWFMMMDRNRLICHHRSHKITP